MFDDFILRALAAGIGIALIAGTLGCFIVWRRMAYFSDSLAHSALLGIALGVVVGSVNLGIVVVCSIFALALLWLQQKKVLATDTLLGILAHAGLSIGMVTISILDQRLDLYAYLFGDILTVTANEVYWIYLAGTVILSMLFFNWSSLVLMTIHEELAMVEGVRTLFVHLLFIFLMTVFVAISIRIVGILLVTSMLIIPAATARQLVKSPEGMAMVAALLGTVAVVCGLFGSIQFDTPSGPSIVATTAALFILLFSVSNLRLKRLTNQLRIPRS